MYSSDFTDSLLQNYFSKPRFLRCQDVFGVCVKEYSPDCHYSAIDPELTVIYFIVRSIKSKDPKTSSTGCYAVYKETTLIQKNHIHSYLPKTNTCDLPIHFSALSDNMIEKHLQCPPSLEDALNQLKACILPFVAKGR